MIRRGNEVLGGREENNDDKKVELQEKWQESRQKIDEWEVDPMEGVMRGMVLVANRFLLDLSEQEWRRVIEEDCKKEDYDQVRASLIHFDSAVSYIKQTDRFKTLQQQKLGHLKRNIKEVSGWKYIIQVLELLLVSTAAFGQVMQAIDNALNPDITLRFPERLHLPPSVVRSYLRYEVINVNVSEKIREILREWEEYGEKLDDKEGIERVLRLIKGLLYFKFWSNKNIKQATKGYIGGKVNEGLLLIAQRKLEEAEELLASLVLNEPDLANQTAAAVAMGVKVNEVTKEEFMEWVEDTRRELGMDVEVNKHERWQERAKVLQERLRVRNQQIKQENNDPAVVEQVSSMQGKYILVIKDGRVFVRLVEGVKMYKEYVRQQARVVQLRTGYYGIWYSVGRLDVYKALTYNYKLGAEGLESSHSVMYTSSLIKERESIEQLIQRVKERGGEVLIESADITDKVVDENGELNEEKLKMILEWAQGIVKEYGGLSDEDEVGDF